MARFPPALSSPTSSNSHGDTPHTSPIHKQGPDVLPYHPRRGQLSQVPCGFEPIGGARLSERFSIDFCNQERALNLSILTVSGPEHSLAPVLEAGAGAAVEDKMGGASEIAPPLDASSVHRLRRRSSSRPVGWADPAGKHDDL
ncbi:hypothetical protein IWZ01DRAFT_487018 [Phyllosticta capitalensis]